MGCRPRRTSWPQGQTSTRWKKGCLKLKGKRLDAVKTEQARVVLRPLIKRVFTLKPRIVYVDESGDYKSYESEPVEVNVTPRPTTRIS